MNVALVKAGMKDALDWNTSAVSLHFFKSSDIFLKMLCNIIGRINDECCMSEGGKVALLLSFSQYDRLRKKCHLSHTFTCAYNVANTLPIYQKSISTHVHNSKQLKQLGHATMHRCIQIGTKDDNTTTTS